MTVIGDEDQSIYGFRHAHPEGIVEYPQTHAGTHNELLNECRRCPQRVVEIANALINHNQRLDPRPLTCTHRMASARSISCGITPIGDEIQTLADISTGISSNILECPLGEVLVLRIGG